MNIVQRIAKNITVLVIAQIASHLLAFFYMMYTARYLGPASFGILSFALAFTGIFAVFADFGLCPLTVREVARDKSLAPKYLANLSLIKVILVAITFGLIALTINLMGYPDETIKVVYLLALSVVFIAFTQMFYSIFHAYQRMEYQSLGQILNSVLMLSGVMLVIRYDFSVVGFASLFLLASIIGLIYSFVILRWKLFNPSLVWFPRGIEIDWSFWKETLKEALPFGLAIIFVNIFYWTDSVMLSLMKGDAVVGWYNGAYRMVAALLFIPGTFIAAIFPIMSEFYKTSHDSLMLCYEKYFKYLAILGIPIAVGTTLLAQRFVLLMLGAEYTDSIRALQILVWSTVFIFINSSTGYLLLSSDRQAIVAKIAGTCAALNVVLNLILIPKYSFTGASITTVLTQFLSLTLTFIWASKFGYAISKKELVNIITKVSISSALMGIFIMCFHNLTLLALVPAAGLLYFVVLYMIRGIDKEDIDLVRRVVQRT